MSPTINVNLTRCGCGDNPDSSLRHAQGHCPALPVPIPCSLPRSVTFTVRLEECICGDEVQDTGSDRRKVEVLQHGDNCPMRCRCVAMAQGNRAFLPAGHYSDCPARPVRVTCSVAGETWAGSEVGDMECHRGTHDDHVCAIEGLDVLQVCREHWALVKALVLDLTAGPGAVHDELRPLISQRDVVFAALADMERAEEALKSASERLPSAIRNVLPWGPESSPSRLGLTAYVEHLIEQVGRLP